MEKKHLIFFSCGIAIGLVLGAYLCVQVFHSEIVKAYAPKPANGHSWTEMECTSGLCVTSDNKVGVGLDNPTEKLQVVGNIKASGDICNSAGNCLSALASITNACGTAAKTYVYAATAFSGTYCSIGSPTPAIASLSFPAAGSTTTWTCPVVNGSPVSCTATHTGAPVVGACGSANGASSYSAPTTNLCTNGTPTSVTQSGLSFYWSCVGQSGGSTATCSSNVKANGSCGSTGPYASLSVGICSIGTPSALSGSGPWTWSCSGVNGGNTTNCSALYGHTSCPTTYPWNGRSSTHSTGVIMCSCCTGGLQSTDPCYSWRPIVNNSDPGASCGTGGWFY